MDLNSSAKVLIGTVALAVLGCKSQGDSPIIQDPSTIRSISAPPEEDAVPPTLILHSLESKGPDEDATITTILGIIKKSIARKRDAHPKAHACFESGELTVSESLPDRLRVGVFATPGKKFQSVLRFSSGSNDPLASDLDPNIHGLAVKIMSDELDSGVPDIEGEEMFMERKFYKSFDIITISNVEEFVVNDLSNYFDFFGANRAILTKTWEAILATAEGKKALAQSLADAEAAKGAPLTDDEKKAAARKAIISAENSVSPKEKADLAMSLFTELFINKIPRPEIKDYAARLAKDIIAPFSQDVLAETYNSWVPYAMGPTDAVKYTFEPCDSIRRSTNQGPKGRNFLGDNLKKSVKESGACFRLMAQFFDPKANPPWSIEEAIIPWGDPQSRNKILVGTVEVPSGSVAMDQGVCEALSYNPAHALPSQRGIGVTQRARRLIYATIESLRNKQVQAQIQ